MAGAIGPKRRLYVPCYYYFYFLTFFLPFYTLYYILTVHGLCLLLK